MTRVTKIDKQTPTFTEPACGACTVNAQPYTEDIYKTRVAATSALDTAVHIAEVRGRSGTPPTSNLADV
jgi:hypothetical protein